MKNPSWKKSFSSSFSFCINEPEYRFFKGLIRKDPKNISIDDIRQLLSTNESKLREILGDDGVFLLKELALGYTKPENAIRMTLKMSLLENILIRRVAPKPTIMRDLLLGIILYGINKNKSPEDIMRLIKTFIENKKATFNQIETLLGQCDFEGIENILKQITDYTNKIRNMGGIR